MFTNSKTETHTTELGELTKNSYISELAINIFILFEKNSKTLII
jgi:hypothetical protein